MLRFGMPTLIETATIEECAALCRDAGLSFIEMNMNLPQYQVETMDEIHLKQVAKEYGIDYTIHLDENLAPADFSPQVAAAYRQVAVDTVEFAKKMEIPTLNMHLIQGEGVPLRQIPGLLPGQYAPVPGRCDPGSGGQRSPGVHRKLAWLYGLPDSGAG